MLSERDRAMLLGLLKRNTQNNGGDDNPPLSILFDRWHAERKPPAKTWLEWKTALRCFTEANGGDLPVKAITKGHVRTFKAALLNRKNSNDATKSLGLASVQKNLTALHTVLEYAVRQGYVETNAASKVGRVAATEAPAATGEDRRLPFTPEQARSLIESLPEDGAFRWVPLIGLYSGCRLGEIVGLRPDDLREEDGVRYFDIRPHDARRLKTASSRRRVPVHPMLAGVERVLPFKVSPGTSPRGSDGGSGRRLA